MQTTTDPKLTVRRADDRFHSQFGWLDSRHTFSFGEHHHPDHMGYRSLRVINDDRVAPEGGFGTHPHHSMEIFTYVISGELEHKDSMGNGRVIKEGEFQYMSAANGVTHSEFNPSSENAAHFLQIWITPASPGGEPRYHDFDTKPLREENGLALLASPGGDKGSMAIRQHAQIHFGNLAEGASLPLAEDKNYPLSWLHVIKGELKAGKITLKPGDGASFEGALDLSAGSDTEFLLFRLV